MITYKNCTRKQKHTLTCIASSLLYNVIRDRLEEFKKVSNLFYREQKKSINEHYNLYDDHHGCLDVAFDLTLTDEEITIEDETGELWEEFFEIYYKHEQEFKYSHLLVDESANERAAEKVLTEWEYFLNGYRCVNNKITEHETTY